MVSKNQGHESEAGEGLVEVPGIATVVEIDRVWQEIPGAGMERAVELTAREGNDYLRIVAGGDVALRLAVALKNQGIEAMREHARRFGELNDEGERVFPKGY